MIPCGCDPLILTESSDHIPAHLTYFISTLSMIITIHWVIYSTVMPSSKLVEIENSLKNLNKTFSGNDINESSALPIRYPRRFMIHRISFSHQEII